MSRKFGNAQTIGNQLHQNTYFMTKQEGDSFLAVLADGTVDTVTGAYAAILACETIAKGFVFTGDLAGELEQQFASAAAVLNDRLYKGRIPRVSVLAACFHPRGMTYKRVGDLWIAGFDGKSLSELEPERGERTARESATLLCNRGVRQALSEIEIELLLSGRAHPYKKAQKMIEAINRKNLKDQKSSLLVIVK